METDEILILVLAIVMLILGFIGVARKSDWAIVPLIYGVLLIFTSGFSFGFNTGEKKDARIL